MSKENTLFNDTTIKRLVSSINLTIKQKKAYDNFYNSARNNDILEPKTTLMIHLAAALALGCYP